MSSTTVESYSYLLPFTLCYCCRFHIGKVYRRDEPQMARGRFREFYQCDFDIAGDYEPMVADAEVIGVLVDVLRSMKGAVGGFQVKLNHRGLLDAVMQLCGVPMDACKSICSAIDKLDKLSWEEVKKEMCEVKGLHPDVADRIYPFVNMRGPPLSILQQLEDMQELRKLLGAEVRESENYHGK